MKVYTAIALGCLTAISFNVSAFSAVDETKWKGTAGNYTVFWSNSDIEAFHKDQPQKAVYSEFGYLKDRFHADVKDFVELTNTDDEGDGVDREATAEFISWDWQTGILSWLPPYLSLERSEYFETYPSAHPGMVHEFQAVDLSKQGKPALLTDIFPDSVVLQALLNDPLIKPIRQKLPTFKTSKDFVEYMSKNAIEIRSKKSGDCDTYYMPSDFLSRFAFHHVEKDKVAVRLSLTYMYEVCRGEYTQMGLLLPTPAKIKPALDLADTKKQGFLMKDANKIFFEKSTSLGCGYVSPQAYKEAETNTEFKQMLPTYGNSKLTSPTCWSENKD